MTRPHTPAKGRIGSMFSGYGGLCHLTAAPMLGMDVAWHAETDPAACKVLERHAPGTPNLGDVTAVDWADVKPVHGDTPFSVPLISHITGNLWTGGCRAGVRLPDDFVHVVSLYPWERYDLGRLTKRLEMHMFDSTEALDLPTVCSTAGYVAGCVRDGQTLVHCQAGLNRSGLIAGLALVFGGHSPAEAIGLLRQARSPAVLCNPTFESLLRGWV